MYSKQEAQKIAKLLKSQLGKNWKVKVFENLGWFVHADCGPLHVSWDIYSRDAIIFPKFGCMMADHEEYQGTGSYLWHINDYKKFSDAREAVKRQVECARQKVNELNKLVEKTEKEVKNWKTKTITVFI